MRGLLSDYSKAMVDMARYNDLETVRWREYEDIWTDSLWIIEKRDNSGAHSGTYHGNFVPQIPHQLLLRYTKCGDWVLDPFSGSGTTLIEAQRLERNSIGIELQDRVAVEALSRIRSESRTGVAANQYVGDSRCMSIESILEENGIERVHFVLLHPPYWNILKFSDRSADLSNASTVEDFIADFGKVVGNACAVLEKDRYIAVVIGDKYAKGEIVPLGFYCMKAMREYGLKQKATIVKNFEDTKGKSGQKSIWRYRALMNDFYIFKHEYIFVFKKER
jgi:DNA modification methylase